MSRSFWPAACFWNRFYPFILSAGAARPELPMLISLGPMRRTNLLLSLSSSVVLRDALRRELLMGGARDSFCFPPFLSTMNVAFESAPTLSLGAPSFDCLALKAERSASLLRLSLSAISLVECYAASATDFFWDLMTCFWSETEGVTYSLSCACASSSKSSV